MKKKNLRKQISAGSNVLSLRSVYTLHCLGETLNGGRHVLDKGNYLREGKGSAGPKVPDRKEAMGGDLNMGLRK